VPTGLQESHRPPLGTFIPGSHIPPLRGCVFVPPSRLSSQTVSWGTAEGIISEIGFPR